jgi:hypothetical protein
LIADLVRRGAQVREPFGQLVLADARRVIELGRRRRVVARAVERDRRVLVLNSLV